jgi:hypothetical protein
MNDSVNILGTVWKIKLRKGKNDAGLKGIGGYCDDTIKTIVIRKQHKHSDSDECGDLREYEKGCLRHEIVHAFFFESGLAHDATSSRHWAMHEEMIDWIARQHSKMHAAFEEAGAL